MFLLYHVLFCTFAISSQICKAFLGLGTGHEVQGGGAMKIFFLSTGFQWPTPELFNKIGAAHTWSGTEKTSDPPPNQNQ